MPEESTCEHDDCIVKTNIVAYLDKLDLEPIQRAIKESKDPYLIIDLSRLLGELEGLQTKG
jgi:hypothetical protein